MCLNILSYVISLYIISHEAMILLGGNEKLIFPASFHFWLRTNLNGTVYSANCGEGGKGKQRPHPFPSFSKSDPQLPRSPQEFQIFRSQLR